MIEQLLQDQLQALQYFYAHVSAGQLQAVLDLVAGCMGTVITTGVGKSGFIAQKIAATLLSTGTQAAFLSPGGALHGDLAVVKRGDVVLAFSKSGETEELLDLIPYFNQRGAQVVAVTSAAHSRLERASQQTVHMPLQRELCPFDLAPTTSTALQLLVGDVLAVALMHRKGIKRELFATNHPGGLIGRRIALRVEELMVKGEALPLCSPKQTLLELLPELSAKRCGCLIARDEAGQLQGVFTDGDLRRALERLGSKALETKIETLMSKAPRTAAPGELAWDAMRRMEDPTRPVTSLPVLQEGRVVGLIRMHDILQEDLC